ncbi:MAG: class I ribonucleotide reductase maintenance protein YfaE [Shewanella sp.]|nr:class I ribonucleotide reductase maintenance protein YfaE [Shewanella sp.]MCF1430219.1 class I ribonucleotide reductase maintenance protein YfaE [Shewanella sp.]MCF1437716.1 class I ribonucleotide reductase maintenance protein YfaE [Shewanella sp.]MCF1459281.1 class I ribonucleotide reductase maintenance protein YfaE [Shewanella sp.]
MSSLTLIFRKDPIVSLQGQPVLLFNQQHRTLLEALEFKKINIFSQCRSGYCGACKTRLLAGKVTYLTPPLASLEADECLPCCCVPDSNVNLDLSVKGAQVITRPPHILRKTLLLD